MIIKSMQKTVSVIADDDGVRAIVQTHVNGKPDATWSPMTITRANELADALVYDDQNVADKFKDSSN